MPPKVGRISPNGGSSASLSHSFIAILPPRSLLINKMPNHLPSCFGANLVYLVSLFICNYNPLTNALDSKGITFLFLIHIGVIHVNTGANIVWGALKPEHWDPPPDLPSLIVEVDLALWRGGCPGYLNKLAATMMSRQDVTRLEDMDHIPQTLKQSTTPTSSPGKHKCDHPTPGEEEYYEVNREGVLVKKMRIHAQRAKRHPLLGPSTALNHLPMSDDIIIDNPQDDDEELADIQNALTEMGLHAH